MIQKLYYLLAIIGVLLGLILYVSHKADAADVNVQIELTRQQIEALKQELVTLKTELAVVKEHQIERDEDLKYIREQVDIIRYKVEKK